MEQKIDLLLVDDNIDFISCCEQQIKQVKNFNLVGIAYNGKEAVEFLENKRADIIILDNIMPYLDGLGVIEYINSIECLRKPKIIVTSVMENNFIINNMRNLGILYYLLKPFTVDILIERIMQMSSKDIYDINLLEKQIIINLEHLGMSIETKGYLYIKKAIIILIKEGIDNINISDIYEQLSKTYRHSSKSIEKAIRKSIEITFSKGNFKELNGIFEYDISIETGKTSNKKFIYKLAQAIICDEHI